MCKNVRYTILRAVFWGEIGRGGKGGIAVGKRGGGHINSDGGCGRVFIVLVG